MLIERDFTLPDFTSCIGDMFQVRPHPQIREPDEADWQFEIELVEAEDQTVRFGGIDQGGLRNPFALLFRGSKDVLLPNRVFRIKHDGLGEFDLFLTPVLARRVHPSQAEYYHYEAIFN